MAERWWVGGGGRGGGGRGFLSFLFVSDPAASAQVLAVSSQASKAKAAG